MQQRWMIFALYLCSCFSAVAQPWHLEGFQIEQKNEQVNLKLDKFVIEGETFEHIDYTCPKSVEIYPEHQCIGAKLAVDWQGQSWDLDLDSAFDFNQQLGGLKAHLFNRQLSVNYTLNTDLVDISLTELQFKSLSDWLPDVVNDSFVGSLDGGAVFDLAELKLSGKSLLFSGIEGGYGNDLLVSQLAGSLETDISVATLGFNWHVAIQKGEALLGPVYVNFSQFPLKVSGELHLDGVDGWSLKTTVQQTNNLHIDLLTKFNDKGDITFADLKVDVIDSASINKHVLAAVLDLYGFKQSEMEGGFQLSAQYDGQQITEAQIQFNDYYFNNSLRKLSASALNGTMYWHKSEQKVSVLDWDELLLAGMPVDKSGARFEFYDDQFKVIGMPEWPVFDGSIVVTHWHMSEIFSDSVDMEVAAEIRPISLALVTEKMGWPLMKGSLSGDIPAVIKRGAVISLAGGLDLNVFDGKMKVNELSTERLFGVAPVIAADVSFDELNLGQLTETFGFGRITGLLSGKVDNLRVTNWRPDRLRAEIYTVEKKGVKQTISQQAVDHISSIGGIQGALSRTFLRFFDDFKYKKIKLSCILRNAVCKIGGINNTSKQFTIVEGGGIPKINIVGYVREVDWDTLISRLLNANYEG